MYLYFSCLSLRRPFDRLECLVKRNHVSISGTVTTNLRDGDIEIGESGGLLTTLDGNESATITFGYVQNFTESSYYIKPNRDNVIFSLSGYLHKGKTPERVIIDIAQRLIEITGYSDENPEKVFQTIRDTCTKDPVSDQVNGYKRLHEALTFASPPDSKLGSVSNTILEIEYTLKGIGLFKSEASLWLSSPCFSSVLTPRDSSSFSHQLYRSG